MLIRLTAERMSAAPSQNSVQSGPRRADESSATEPRSDGGKVASATKTSIGRALTCMRWTVAQKARAAQKPAAAAA